MTQTLISKPFVSYLTYAELVGRLLPATRELWFIALDGALLWSNESAREHTPPDAEQLAVLGEGCGLLDQGQPVAAFPVRHVSTVLARLVLVLVPLAEESTEQALRRTEATLAPVCQCLGRELAHARVAVRHLSSVEPTAEMEWLLSMSAELRSTTDEAAATEKLLAAAVECLNVSCSALLIPERQLNLTHASHVLGSAEAVAACARFAPQLLRAVKDRAGPVLASRTVQGKAGAVRHEIIAVPIARQKVNVAGVIAFFRPAVRGEFSRRELSLARHVAQQISVVLEHKYDAATGLLTRAAFEEQVARVLSVCGVDQPHSVVYINIDRLHVVNETFGFDTGDDVITRVANLLRQPTLLADVIASRITGDSFAVFFRERGAELAQTAVQSLQRAAAQIVIGPPDQHFLVSMSCGIVELPKESEPFSRPLAAAELACRTAKNHGRNRCEVYQRDLE